MDLRQAPSASPPTLLPRWLPLLLALAAALFLLSELTQRQAQIDDAYISYRYARNLALGHGLVYNPGDYVEGFTNLLWTLLIAAALRLGIDAPTAGHWLGVAGGLATLLGTCALALPGLPASRRWLAGLAPWVLLASPALVRWSESGLETCFFTAFTTAALATALRERMVWASLCLCLATATRPDGALLAAVLLAFHLAPRWREGLRPWLPVGIYAGFVLALTLFRLAYYGSPIPNTFFAKVSTAVSLLWGLGTLALFLSNGIALLLIPAAVGAWLEPRLRAAAAYCGVVMVYVVAVGGDALGHTRFFVTILPCLVVLALHGVSRAWDRRRGLACLLAAPLALALLWQVRGFVDAWALAGVAGSALAATAWLEGRRALRLAGVAGGLAACVGAAVWVNGKLPGEGLASRQERIETFRRISSFNLDYVRPRALRLARLEPTPRLLGSASIGYLGWYSELPILDLVGLVDRRVAQSDSEAGSTGLPAPGHQRSNPGYVLEREPDFLLMPKRSAFSMIRAQSELWNHPDFERLYVWDPRFDAYRRADREFRDPAAGRARKPQRRLHDRLEPSP